MPARARRSWHGGIGDGTRQSERQELGDCGKRSEAAGACAQQRHALGGGLAKDTGVRSGLGGCEIGRAEGGNQGQHGCGVGVDQRAEVASRECNTLRLERRGRQVVESVDRDEERGSIARERRLYGVAVKAGRSQGKTVDRRGEACLQLGHAANCAGVSHW